MADLTAADVIGKARELLEIARLGLGDMAAADPNRKRPGLLNCIVFGRAAANVLGKLKAVDRQAVTPWYDAKQQAMYADPLVDWFIDVRNDIEHEGAPSTSTVVEIALLDAEVMAQLNQLRPPGAGAMFFGDGLGGSGWFVATPDGGSEKFYVTFPAETGIRVTQRLPDPPAEHLGQPVDPDTPLEELGRLFLDYIAAMIDDAEQRFGGL